VEEARSFDRLDYRFSAGDSDEDTYVFIREPQEGRKDEF